MLEGLIEGADRPFPRWARIAHGVAALSWLSAVLATYNGSTILLVFWPLLYLVLPWLVVGGPLVGAISVLRMIGVSGAFARASTRMEWVESGLWLAVIILGYALRIW